MITVTREDLLALEQALRRGDQGVKAQDILNKYLHPTVTTTFTVTVKRPGNYTVLQPEGVRAFMTTGAHLMPEAEVTVEGVSAATEGPVKRTPTHEQVVKALQTAIYLRGNRVDEWPEDEASLYRHVRDDVSMTAATQRVNELILDKAALAVLNLINEEAS